MDKPRSQDKTRQSELYQVALKSAYRENGCMKIFNLAEDKAIVRSGDIYIHAGQHSGMTGATLQNMAGIRGDTRFGLGTIHGVIVLKTGFIPYRVTVMGGKTPAEALGVILKGPDKWLTAIRHAALSGPW